MADLVRVADHEARGVALLTEQFKHRLSVVALLQTWLGQVQALEDAANELVLQRTLEQATGVNLDILGALVGQPREGRTDVAYRVWIGARALVNRSSGTTAQLLTIAAKLCGRPVWLEEQYPAGFTVHALQPVLGTGGLEIARLLKRAKAAGVAMHFRWGATTHMFRFSVTGMETAPDSSDQGFSTSRLAAVSDGVEAYAPHIRGPGGGRAIVVVL